MTRIAIFATVPPVLDFDEKRTPVAPRPAATLILLRDAEAGEIEICVMQRSNQSSFMGGAVVFPGGRIEQSDAASAWQGHVTLASGAWCDDEGTAARIAACREAIEEVGVAPLAGSVTDSTLRTLQRAAATSSDALRAALADSGVRLDLAALVPFARWVTPEAEQRRFDARFFLARAPLDVHGSSDQHEATRVFWASPRALLADFEQGALTLFPPTHRTLELLLDCRSVDAALALARDACLDVVCPRFLMEDGAPVLALPGDPAHEVRERRVAGGSRYVLHDGRWISKNPEPSHG